MTDDHTEVKPSNKLFFGLILASSLGCLLSPVFFCGAMSFVGGGRSSSSEPSSPSRSTSRSWRTSPSSSTRTTTEFDNSPRQISTMREWGSLNGADRVRYCQIVSDGFLANGSCRACMDAIGPTDKSVASALDMCRQRR